MKLFAFDLENTLIYNELLPDLAQLVGREEEVRRITRLGVEGKIDWEEGFRQRASFLVGLHREDVQKVAGELRLVPGALGFVKSLRGRGHAVGLITGGPSEIAESASRLFNADRAVSNDFIYHGDTFTGKVTVRVKPASKGVLALQMAASLGIAPDDIVAFADGVMDERLLTQAAVSVAINSQGSLRDAVDYEAADFEDAYQWLNERGIF
ncbi:MAG: HAD family phosphatase [candidate division NC10 bacterium]